MFDRFYQTKHHYDTASIKTLYSSFHFSFPFLPLFLFSSVSFYPLLFLIPFFPYSVSISSPPPLHSHELSIVFSMILHDYSHSSFLLIFFLTLFSIAFVSFRLTYLGNTYFLYLSFIPSPQPSFSALIFPFLLLIYISIYLSLFLKPFFLFNLLSLL